MLYELLTGVAADRCQGVPARGDPGDAADGAGGRSAAAEHEAEHGRSPAEHRGQPEHRARPAHETDAGRTRLGGDEGVGEGPQPRRYETANGLARDIQRYLADEVVEARPPSRGYRLKKFVRRNPLQLALAGTVVLLLLGGAAFAWWQDRQMNQRRAEARNREQQAYQGVDAALTLVPDLRKQYKFEAARKTLEQAAILAKGAAPDRLAEVQQALQDVAFVEQLDDIRYRKWLWITDPGGNGNFNEKIAAPAYRQAFAERALDLKTLDPAVSARRIAASAVKAELVAAVDDWALHEPERGLRIGCWTSRVGPTRGRGPIASATQRCGATGIPSRNWQGTPTLPALPRRRWLSSRSS